MRGRTVLFGDVLSALISTFQRKSSLLPMGKYIFTARMLSPSFNRAHPKQSLWRRSKSGLAFGWCARGPSSKAHHHKSRVLTWIWLDTINYCYSEETRVNWWRTTFKLKDKNLSVPFPLFVPITSPVFLVEAILNQPWIFPGILCYKTKEHSLFRLIPTLSLNYKSFHYIIILMFHLRD